jgi:hypothetical protein
LLVDPYLSRVPARYLAFGRPVSNASLIRRHLLSPRLVLVTHPHFDHLMDVPFICREFGAAAYGSANTCAILRAHDIPPEQIKEIRPGDAFADGPFSIRVFAAVHGRIFGRVPYTNPLPKRLIPPLRLSDYRLDCELSFEVRTGSLTVLFWNRASPYGAPSADVLVITTERSPKAFGELLRAVQPKAVIPIHWDDFFRSLEKPIQPMIGLPGWTGRLFGRMDPHVFARALQREEPATQVIVPRIFDPIDLGILR